MSAIKQDLSGPRLSSLVMGCPRQTFYQAAGAPKRDVTYQESRWFARGHAISNAVRDEIIEELREDGQRPVRELAIPWPHEKPIGVGHADVWIARDKRIVEITSTAGGKLLAHKARQAAAYALNHAKAEEAYVCAVDPSAFDPKWYPVDWEALAPEIKDLQAEAAYSIEHDVEPVRRCKRPSDAQKYHCPYADHCFADWEGEIEDVSLDLDLRRLIVDLADAESEVSTGRRELKLAEGERNLLRDEVRQRIPAGEPLIVGDYKVKRSVSESQTFSLRAYLDAGHSITELMDPFVSTSSRESWQVREARNG